MVASPAIAPGRAQQTGSYGASSHLYRFLGVTARHQIRDILGSGAG
ncbi:hypothetical protein [Microbispora sp. NPDC049125]